MGAIACPTVRAIPGWRKLGSQRKFWWIIVREESHSFCWNYKRVGLVCVCVLSRVWLFEIQWTVALQTPLFMDFPARILEWVVILFSRGSFQPQNRTHISCISCIGRHILYPWATWQVGGFVFLLGMMTWENIWPEPITSLKPCHRFEKKTEKVTL